MKLKRLSYFEKDWRISKIDFENVSLIVGKNSTGKSKTLSVIDSLGKILMQRDSLHPKAVWNIHISSDNEVEDINYTFETDIEKGGSVIVFEHIKIADRTVLYRDRSEYAKIHNYLDEKDELIYPPANKLIIHTNRDLKKYPFLEHIVLWAEQSFGFKFANISPDKPFNEQRYNLINSVEEIPELYYQLSDEIRDSITNDLNKIGFDIKKIQLVIIANETIKLIRIYEDSVTDPLFLNWLSQGLFRCISLLIFLEYLIAKKKPATVIIDDLCEGLDYERATKLGKLVFEKCLANNIQLIATSNDAFLMETVDLKYWNVLQRNGSVVTSLNAKNHPDLFRDFKFTGLSNFDFFASDYIAQKLEA